MHKTTRQAFATLVPASLMLMVTWSLHAQSQSAGFEVASIRRNVSGSSRGSVSLPDSGQVIVSNATVRMLVSFAYELDRFALVAPANNPLIGKDQTDGPKFDVQARPPEGAPPGRQRLMLQRLLADRFNLRVHREIRPTQLYALTMVRNGRFGPDLAPSENDCKAWTTARTGKPDLPEPRHRNGTPLCIGALARQPGITLLRAAGPASEIKRQIQSFVDRPLFDETGLTGNFEWTLSFALNAPDTSHPSLFTAVEEQLGLKLESRTAPYEVLVIDTVDWPTSD